MKRTTVDSSPIQETVLAIFLSANLGQVLSRQTALCARISFIDATSIIKMLTFSVSFNLTKMDIIFVVIYCGNDIYLVTC